MWKNLKREQIVIITEIVSSKEKLIHLKYINSAVKYKPKIYFPYKKKKKKKWLEFKDWTLS